MTDALSFLAGVEFVLRHYESHKTNGSPFELTEIDPKEWWSLVNLKPKLGQLPNSEAHLEARVQRWKELAKEYLND